MRASVRRVWAMMVGLSLFLVLIAGSASAEDADWSASRGGSSVEVHGASLFGDRYPLEIMPQVELVMAVFNQTKMSARFRTQGPSKSAYLEALMEFMEPWRDHEAVRLAERFADSYFPHWSRIPGFAANLSTLPHLDLLWPYNQEYLPTVAPARDLEALRLAMKSLAEEADFSAFLEDWRPYLESAVKKASDGFRKDDIAAWVRHFCGDDGRDLHIILMPSCQAAGAVAGIAGDTDARLVYAMVAAWPPDGAEIRFPPR